MEDGMSVSPVGRKRAFRLFLGVLFPCLPLFPLLLGGCGGRTPHIPSSSASEARMTADIRKLLEQREEIVMAGSCRRSLSESTRDACYRYSPVPQRPPAVGTPRKISRTTPAKTVKNVGKIAGNAQIALRHHDLRGGLCQPQCLLYARCRTGFQTCMLGNTTSISWATCARQNGTLSSSPVAGSALLLDRRRNIRSGHVIYVEETCRLKSGNWLLRISHANYDGTCRLDLDSKALFFPKTGCLTVLTGPWKRWAADLRVLGFVTG